MTVIYISYDGLMEQLGQSQVLPYLKGLAHGRSITLITYEKSHDFDDNSRRSHFAAVTENAGIRWIPLRYHRKPTTIATAYDILIGFIVCCFLLSTNRVQIIHARSYVPSVIVLWLKRIFKISFIFDCRGFWIDQRVELGDWREGTMIVRFARWIETGILQRADVVSALSPAAVLAMRSWPAVIGRDIRFEVVTTCTNLKLFKPPPDEARLRHNKSFTLGYVGNAGRGYRFDLVIEIYIAIRNCIPDARFKIVNRNDHDLIKGHLAAYGVDIADVELIACDYPQVPSEIWEIDLGVFFYEWKKTHMSSVPTRMGEFLACGVPCISDESGWGVLEILEKEGVGVALRHHDVASIDAAVAKGISLANNIDIRRKCVKIAQQYFSLETGVSTYEKIYRGLENDITWI